MKLRRSLYTRTHEDYKGTLDGVPSILMLDRKTGGTVLVTVELVDGLVPREECEHPFIQTAKPTDTQWKNHVELVCSNCCATQLVQWWDSHDERIRRFLASHPPASQRMEAADA